jgi:hypothetical protein
MGCPQVVAQSSVVTSKAANGGQVKSGQRISLESGALLDVVGYL